MTLISMYKNSTDTLGVAVDYLKVLKGIQDGKWSELVQNTFSCLQRSGEDYSNAKKLLPSVTFAGVFNKRAADQLNEYSNMIILDIDKLSEGQVKDYKMAFTTDAYVHACFISPSRAGLKILVKIDGSPDDHLTAFLALEKYFKDTYAVKIDPSGKDVSRLCYVSHDESTIINQNSVSFTYDKADPDIKTNTKRGFDDRPERFKGYVLSKDAKYAFKVCEAWTQRHHQYVEGNRNNYIFVLCCNANRAGIDENDIALMVYNNYNDLPYSEIESTIKSAYSRKSEFNTIDIYNTDEKDLPEHNDEELEMSQYEETIYKDTLTMLNNGVSKKLIGKLIKTFGISHLQMSEKEVSDVMNKAFKKFKNDTESDSMDHQSVEDALLNVMEDFSDNGGVQTTVTEFDEALGGGLMPGCLYGLIGDGGTYKSIFAHFVAAEEANRGGLALYLNGEMSRLQLLDRVVNKELGMHLILDLKNKKITKEQLPDLVEKLKSKCKGSFEIVNGSGWTKESIIQTVNNIESKTGKKVSIIVADGLSQMENSQKDEIKSAIFNSGELKEVAKEVNAPVIMLVHVSGGIGKHVRDTSKFVRGGTKIINNMDGMFCTSLLVDENESNIDGGDILYRQNIFYMRMMDKRGSGSIISKIIQVQRPMRLDALPVDPSTMEVKMT